MKSERTSIAHLKWELKYYDRHSTHNDYGHSVNARLRNDQVSRLTVSIVAHIFPNSLSFLHISWRAQGPCMRFDFFLISIAQKRWFENAEKGQSKGYSEKRRESEPFFSLSFFFLLVEQFYTYFTGSDITFTFTSTSTHVRFPFRRVLGTDCVHRPPNRRREKVLGEVFYDLREKPINYYRLFSLRREHRYRSHLHAEITAMHRRMVFRVFRGVFSVA